jgi:hypothetical protein
MLIARGSGRRPLHQPGRGVVAQLVMRDFAWKTGELHGASELFFDRGDRHEPGFRHAAFPRSGTHDREI